MRLGDLDALKREFRNVNEGMFQLSRVYELIDNVPTAEPEKVLVANVTFDKDELKRLVDERVIEPIKNGELVIKGEWIPIKTRELTEEEKEEYPDATFMYDCKLPEDGEEVLVTTWAGNVSVDTFCRDDGCYFEYGCDEGDVIAWQPLPEPYQKGGAE